MVRSGFNKKVYGGMEINKFCVGCRESVLLQCVENSLGIEEYSGAIEDNTTVI